MKKAIWTVALCMMLTAVLTTTAAAQAIGIALGEETYVFPGEGTYTADGKTFIIGPDEVVIHEEGKDGLVLPLEKEIYEDTARSQTVMGGYFQSWFEESDIIRTENGQATTNVISSICVQTTSGGQADPARFSAYAPWGLSYDAREDALYYQGKRVRIFEDSYSLDDSSFSTLEHVDEKGVIDVKVQRNISQRMYNEDGSYDPGGTITGLLVLSQEEFAARDISEWSQPKQPQITTALEGEELSAQEKEAIYAPYTEFGLTYDAEQDTFSYQGRRVRDFLDVKQSNGEMLESGRFKGVMTHIRGDDGEIDVRMIRDYTKPDEDGNGMIIGIETIEVR